MQNDKLEILGKVALFHLDIRTWSGRKKLRPEDIKGDVPPKKLASLGSKRIVDPKKVAVFETIKRRAERLLGGVGIRVMGSYAIPLDQVKSMNEQLNAMRDAYTQEKNSFIFTYHRDVEEWIKEQGEWGEIIRTAITPSATVRQQLHFGWQAYQISPTGGDDGLDEEVGGMATQLFNEISRDALRCFEESFLLKTRVGMRAINPIKAIQEKLRGLSFLDARAAAISRFLSDVLLTLPKEGYITGDLLTKLFGVLIVLSSPEKIAEYGQKLLDGESIEDNELMSISSTQPTRKLVAKDEVIEIEPAEDAVSEMKVAPPAWF